MAMEQQQEERYEIQGKIGEGGRGAVYCAYDRQLNRKVAIKRLFTDPGAAEDAHQAIMKESHALSAINSPHIVRVFDIATDEDGPYVVMEYLEGKTLHDIVSNAPLVLQDFLTIAEQALEALIAAHDAKLLHRDIKPGNLMLTWLPSGRIQLKLLDFGLAKFTEKPAIQTIALKGSVLGSIYFMAPEQFERTPLDVRTDLYSLGCVFYHALTGRYPFYGDSVTEVMAAHIQGTCPHLQPLRPDLSAALCRWVMRLVARNMDDRPETAHEALLEFEAARHATAPIPSQPIPSEPRVITAVHADPVTHPVPTGPVPTGPLGGTQPIARLLTTTNQIPLHTTTMVVADPHSRLARSRATTVPIWVFMIGGVLAILIVVLGVATAMRSDPGGTDPPRPVEPDPVADGPSSPSGVVPDPADSTPESLPVETPPETPPADPPRKRWNAVEEFKKKDKNGDFVLSRDEFVTATTDPRKSELERQFVQLDTNGDGQLTMSEFRKHEQNIRE